MWPKNFERSCFGHQNGKVYQFRADDSVAIVGSTERYLLGRSTPRGRGEGAGLGVRPIMKTLQGLKTL